MNERFVRHSSDVRTFAKKMGWHGLEIGVRHLARYAPDFAANDSAFIPTAESAMDQLATLAYERRSRVHIASAIEAFKSLKTYLSFSRLDGTPYVNHTRRSVDRVLRALQPLEDTSPIERQEPNTTLYAFAKPAINYQLQNPFDESALRIRG